MIFKQNKLIPLWMSEIINGWLFDTTYILPWFGIDIDIPQLRDDLKKLLIPKD